MRFHCIDDGVPEPTTRFLRQACRARDLEYVHVDPRVCDWSDERQLGPGDLLYRPAISLTASRVEQFLYDPAVATFYRGSDGIFFNPSTSPLLFQRAGLPIPRTFYVHSTARHRLDEQVAQLGGYPVVVKLMGYSRGMGVMRVDSPASLYSVLDFTSVEGKSPLLCAYIDGATHWRLIVVGERVVAAYRNRVDHNDFRTYADTNPDDFLQAPGADLEDLAVRAVQALHYEFGGVDILAHPSGRLYLLESNFPCYFATPQEVVGTDVAGAMVEYLVRKSERLNASTR